MNDWNDFDGVEVAHGVFSKEVQGDVVILYTLDVLNSQWTAAHSVSFILTFLVADTESQFVNQICTDT